MWLEPLDELVCDVGLDDGRDAHQRRLTPDLHRA